MTDHLPSFWKTNPHPGKPIRRDARSARRGARCIYSEKKDYGSRKRTADAALRLRLSSIAA